MQGVIAAAGRERSESTDSFYSLIVKKVKIEVEKEQVEHVKLGELSDSLGFLLRLAQVKVFDTFYENMQGTGLKPGEFSVLWVIALNTDMPQGAIARRLSIKPAHMTRLIQRLVTAGLVERNTPDNDRRSIRLLLTQQGKKVVTQNRADFIRFHQTERAGLSNNELAQMIKLLKKFTSLD